MVGVFWFVAQIAEGRPQTLIRGTLRHQVRSLAPFCRGDGDGIAGMLFVEAQE